MKIRRILSVFLLTLLLTGLFCVPQASAVDLPQVNAKAAQLMDYESGRMLYGLNARDTEYPASITKVMTALLTLEAVDQRVLTLDQQVAAPALVNDMDPTGSSADIKEGDEIIRQVEAVPTFRVTRHYTDQETARHATQAIEIYGYLVIPNQFEAYASAGRDATLSYYYHYALLSVGGEVRGAFETLLRTLSLAPVVVQATAMGLGENQIPTFLLPVRSSSHPLFTPDLD